MPKPKALLLNCTLKQSPAASNTGALLHRLRMHLVPTYEVAVVRLSDRPGWFKPKGEGTESKLVLEVLRADVLIIGTPIWWGGHSSVAQRVIEMIDDQDDQNRKTDTNPFWGKRAGVVVSGTDDGVQHCVASLAAALSWMGFTIPGGVHVSKLKLSSTEELVEKMLVRSARALGA